MKIEITSIGERTGESVEIKAIVDYRYFPRPNYEDNETDAQYAERVRDIAKDMYAYFNLHLGRATLTQEVENVNIPTVAEYDT